MSVEKNYLLRPYFDTLVKNPKRITPAESTQLRRLKMEGCSIVNTQFLRIVFKSIQKSNFIIGIISISYFQVLGSANPMRDLMTIKREEKRKF